MNFLVNLCNILGFKEYALHESSLSRIWQHSQERTIGLITAFRGEHTYQTNLRRNQQLENAIRANGFGFVKVTGHYIENQGTKDEKKVIENSFLVISEKNDNGRLKGFLKKYGELYDQDSVLYKEYGKKAVIIGTTHRSDAQLKFGVELVVGDWKANKISSMYSQFRGHRRFVFETVKEPENILTLGYLKH